MLSESDVRTALSQVPYPGFSRDIISFGLVKSITIDGNNVKVGIEIATNDAKIPQQIHGAAQAALAKIPGIGRAEIDFDIKNPPAAPTAGAAAVGKAVIPGVKQVIAVASGKGGVGKSTVSANLAVSLVKQGFRVGLCDCDLYGPSVALMFGTGEERPMGDEQERIIPIERHGVQLMSMGFLLDDTSPVIVRGPLATRYIQQFLKQVAWDNLDYLILDLPPGTGDIQLTIVQNVTVAGAVVVTTPQEMALIDARKAASMFAKVNVPILGIVENMAYFQAPDTGTRYDIFGSGGGEKEAARLKVPLLAQIPLDPPTREGGDGGKPVALQETGASPVADAFHVLGEAVAAAVPV